MMESEMGISCVGDHTAMSQTIGIASVGAGIEPRRRILVIDDEEPTRRTVCKMLKSAGYEVVEAEDGNSGTELCFEQRFDLALVDILPSGNSGLMTIAELHEHFPETKLIAISGGDFRGPLSRAPLYGAAAVLQKPIPRSSLLQRVTEVLDEMTFVAAPCEQTSNCGGQA